MTDALLSDVRRLAERETPQMISFLREMVAIPSESAEEDAVVQRICREMEAVGFDEVRVDGLGNVLGRVGSGSRVIAMDAHIDTVGVGDASAWSFDPYQGKLEDGVIWGRGASDQEGGMAAMVYAGKIIKELGLDGDYQLWVVGTVMEEDCDGLCWQYILNEKILAPEVVVITEPTDLGVYRGHRGRMEMEIRVRGRSAHGAHPELGDNAVYKMGPIIAEVERLNMRLEETADPFLGKGSCTISDIRSTSPSLCAVADSCTIHVDRRLTDGETEASAVAELEALKSVREAGAEVRVLEYERAAYTGLVYPTRKYYPTWTLPEDHPAIESAVHVARSVLGREPRVGRWGFSTNGVAICGMHGIPCVGFGPANEIHAHSVDDRCPVADLTAAAQFYALFPQRYLETAVGGTK
ncbi:MAG: YgeY family selenium metabolism-linked hydrolase [Deltaproteobacteria bacterium]|nr:YgeY family selenium metabolism-linked hydrolase [Deltaproteobacteria bacterium]